PRQAEADARLEPHGRHPDDARRRDREVRADPDLQRHARLPHVQARHACRHRHEGDQGREDPRACLQAGRLRPGDRSLMAAELENGYVPRLKERYDEELRMQLREELGLSSVMQVPRIQKITLNMGVGEAKTDAKALDAAIEELTTIAGQRAQLRRARK